jgi:DNA-binding transcriptional ArsR family regulator
MSLSLQKEEGQDEIRLLWDEILDILLERIHHKAISLTELAHLIEELEILLRAVKGRHGVWGSVIDIALQLLRKDVTIHDLISELSYNESTIYRALGRLELAGFATSNFQDGSRCWTINKSRCPVLYRARRQA